MKRAEAKSEKLMHDVARENKRLTEPLSRVRGCCGCWGRQFSVTAHVAHENQHLTQSP